jgi:hypothetical protein
MSGNVPATVLAMIVEGLREVKEALASMSRDVNSQLSKLPDIYVPRREVDHRFDEHTIDIGELRNQVAAGLARHQVDIERIESQIEMTRERHEEDRKWAIGTAIAVVTLLLMVVGLVITVLQH